MATSMVDEWLEADGLILMESWARDGYTVEDIATRIGITQEALRGWMRKYPEIKQAINSGRELVDYKVENALLKAALGYRTRELRVTTTIRNGRIIETVKEKVEKEQAPNVSACQVWLYNRVPKKWKNMNARANILEDMDEDTSIHITVERASAKPEEQSGGEDKEWQDEVNKSVSIRKATPEEKAQAERAKDRAKQEEKTFEGDSIIQSPKTLGKNKKAKSNTSSDGNNVHAKSMQDDIDYWPDDWEDDD